MRPVAILVLASIPLAGCGSEPDVSARNASVAEVAQQVREASEEPGFIRPGKWVSTMAVEEVSASGMPAEAAAQLKQMMGDGRQFESCLAEDEAQRPAEEFFAGANQQCRYDHFTMGNGKIDAKMRCTEGGVSREMEMEGRYAPDSYQIRMTASVEAGSGVGPAVTMRSRVDSKRVGECTARKA